MTGERAALLRELRASIAAAADDWVRCSVAAKGWRDVPHAEAEEWASGPLPVARLLAHLQAPRPPAAPAPGSGVRALRPVARLADPLLLRGHRAHIQVAADERPAPAPQRGGNALVLGAGNVTATPVLDVLDQVFLHGRTVVLKVSPLHDALLPVFATALAPLVRNGRLRVVAGDASAGRELAQRPELTALHLTGSAATWAALRGDPALRGKHLSGEVGCCTPAFVLPGAWRDAELRHVAAQLAAFVASNGGATCLAPRVLLTAASWPQRRALREHIAAAMAALPGRVPFHANVREHYSIATGERAPADALRPVLAAERPAPVEAELCDRELFAPVLREIALPGDELASWWQHGNNFVRERCFGALSAYVFAPPSLLANGRAIVDAAIAALPHGTVAINTWTGLGYGLGTAPWGVPPGTPVECGSGWTRNTTGLPVQRVIVEAPFRPHPLPPWLPAHRRATVLLRALTLHALRPSLLRLAAVAAHAVTNP